MNHSKEVRIIDAGIPNRARMQAYRKELATYRKSKSKIGIRFVKVFPNFATVALNPFDHQHLHGEKL